MNIPPRIGGFVSLAQAGLYIIGFVFLFTLLAPLAVGNLSEAESLAFSLEYKPHIQVWHLLIYVLFGVLLIPLTQVLKAQFDPRAYLATAIAPLFGFIWAGLVIASGMIANVALDKVSVLHASDPDAALGIWQSVQIVHDGLGGGVEVVGGLWVLLISIAGIQEKVLSKGLHFLGLIVGAAGILTVVPGLGELGAVFGLTQILWFIWLGISLIQS